MTENNLSLLLLTTPLDSPVLGGVTLFHGASPDFGNCALHVSQNPDKALAARKALANLTLPLHQWVLPVQRHSDRVCRVSSLDWSKGAWDHFDGIDPADALYTTQPDTLIGVFCADCLGILLCDPAIPLVGAVHSGWKGTAQAILLKTLQALKKDGLLNPQSLRVSFSPSLLAEDLEVGPEVVQQIQAMAGQYGLSLEGCLKPGEGDRTFLDNQKINLRMCQAMGIPEENVHLCSISTLRDPRCFSYRRGIQAKKSPPLTGEHFLFGYIQSNRTKSETVRDFEKPEADR